MVNLSVTHKRFLGLCAGLANYELLFSINILHCSKSFLLKATTSFLAVWQNFCCAVAMEAWLIPAVIFLARIVELIASVIITIGLIQFIYHFALSSLGVKPFRGNVELRVKFGSFLTLALELLLAADILQTAVAPTWNDIGKLAAIAAIRTLLNYFLERDMKNWESERQERALHKGGPVSEDL